MNRSVSGYTYGAVLNPYRTNYKVGQGSLQVQKEAIVLSTVDDTINYGSTQSATDVVLQIPMIKNNGAFIDGGYGALSLQVPDGTFVGGDPRGAGAIDFQMDRTSAQGSGKVASGKRSFIAGGSGNRASGINSFCAGSANTASGSNSFCAGDGNITSGYSSVAIGLSSVASGFSSAAIGTRGTTNTISSKLVFGSEYNSVVGNYQSGILNVAVQTTDATATRLISRNEAVSATNQCTLQNSNAIAFNVEIVARDTVTGDCARWVVVGLIKRGANASTTALVGTPTVTLTHNDAVAWAVVGAIALTADTTNGALAITVTGVAATTVRWLAKIETTEVV